MEWYLFYVSLVFGEGFDGVQFGFLDELAHFLVDHLRRLFAVRFVESHLASVGRSKRNLSHSLAKAQLCDLKLKHNQSTDCRS